MRREPLLTDPGLTAEENDVARLVAWRATAERFGLPVIVALVARKRSRMFPQREELEARQIAHIITETRERFVPRPSLGELSFVRP